MQLDCTPFLELEKPTIYMAVRSWKKDHQVPSRWEIVISRQLTSLPGEAMHTANDLHSTGSPESSSLIQDQALYSYQTKTLYTWLELFNFVLFLVKPISQGRSPSNDIRLLTIWKWALGPDLNKFGKIKKMDVSVLSSVIELFTPCL